MKTAFKSEIREFKVTGVTTSKRKEKELVNLAISAQAKGRLVEWNRITGSIVVDVARIGAKGFGPGDISFRDFDWVVHITRGGKPVVRAMKATPRKDAINRALCQLLAPALLDPDQTSEVAPKVAPETKEDSGLGQEIADTLRAVGLKVHTEVPQASDQLAMPEFLKR
jgi:hypothetical protein